MTYAEKKRHREAKAAAARAERRNDAPAPKPDAPSPPRAPIRTELPRHLRVFMSEEDGEAAEAIRRNGGFGSSEKKAGP